PFALDHGVYVEALERGGGGTLGVIIGDESGERLGVLVGDEERPGVNAGFEGIAGGPGAAFGGARAGGFLGVATVGFGLIGGGHVVLPGNKKASRGSAGRLAKPLSLNSHIACPRQPEGRGRAAFGGKGFRIRGKINFEVPY